tara:strand:- start:972 stop:1688 length:717 start_codon:yes stop_codon:yes gene_type:complete
MMNDLNKNNNQQKDSDDQSWLMTYADMMTLLFAFFVMLYAMSSPDPVKVSELKDSMAKEQGQKGTLQSQNEIKKTFEEIVEDLNLENVANVMHDPRGVALEMDGDICFSSGSTDIKASLMAVLNETSEKILSNMGDYRMVVIEGHTDSAPIPEQLREKYPTNWELSAARASNVVNYLIKKGVNSGRLQASGYADRWPAEVSWYDVRSGKVNDKVIKEKNATRSQMEKNRRIKIVFTNQ